METYWNHNTAFHDQLIANARARGGSVLDVGCGEGLLMQRLAPYVRRAVGIDPDSEAIASARKRLSTTTNARLINEDFLQLPPPAPDDRYDTIISVATLHHMDLTTALMQMNDFLAPGGRLLIVGLAANKSLVDYLHSALLVLPIRLMDRVHGGVQQINVQLAEPKEAFGEIRLIAKKILPGAVLKRKFYYRYLLVWDKPQA